MPCIHRVLVGSAVHMLEAVRTALYSAVPAVLLCSFFASSMDNAVARQSILAVRPENDMFLWLLVQPTTRLAVATAIAGQRQAAFAGMQCELCLRGLVHAYLPTPAGTAAIGYCSAFCGRCLMRSSPERYCLQQLLNGMCTDNKLLRQATYIADETHEMDVRY